LLKEGHLAKEGSFWEKGGVIILRNGQNFQVDTLRQAFGLEDFFILKRGGLFSNWLNSWGLPGRNSKGRKETKQRKS